jgi:hypothetical protein
MSNLKKSIENNELMKKAYRIIKEGGGDLSISIDSSRLNDDFDSEGVKFKSFKTNSEVNNFDTQVNRVVNSIDAINQGLNKDFKELEEIIGNLEKDLKSIY